MINFFTIQGIVFNLVQVSQPRSFVEPLYDSNIGIGAYHSIIPEPVTIETVIFLGYDYDSQVIYRKAISDWMHNARVHECAFVGLGEGMICKYCGNYTPSGGKYCLRCGAELERVPYISPWKIPLLPAHLEWSEIHWLRNENDRINVTFYSNGNEKELIKFIEYSYNGTELTTVPHTIQLERWVCSHCGRIIDEDRPCPTCGGQRLPFSELVKVDAECLYCGKTTTDGPVCKGCQHTLATTTLKEIARTDQVLNQTFNRWKGAM